MSKIEFSKIVWFIIILCFIILIIVGQVKLNNQNEVLESVKPSSIIQKNDNVHFINFEKINFKDIVFMNFQIIKGIDDLSEWVQFDERYPAYYFKKIENYDSYLKLKEEYNITNIVEEDFNNSFAYVLINTQSVFDISWLEFSEDENIKCGIKTEYSLKTDLSGIMGAIFIIPNEMNFVFELNSILRGKICNIEENYIFILDENGVTHRLYCKNLVNYRTRDNINISDLKYTDYFINSEIIRNISGEELKQELLLNLCRAFNSSKLSTKIARLKRLKKYDGYVTFKVSITDSCYVLLGKDNPELFNIELTASEKNTVLYARKNVVNIYNLQKSVRDKEFYLELDEKTLGDERPFVKSFEIAD